MKLFDSQFSTILIGIALILGIIFVVSVITYILSFLNRTELSDQEGYPNFKRPFVGFAILTSVLLGIILIVLILLGIISL